MEKTKVLITGATGFAGGHLLNALPPTDFSIYGTTFPQPPHPSERNIFFLDMRSERDVFELVKTLQPKWVFHLAAISNVRYSWERRKETLETNVIGTLHLFEALKKFAPEARTLYVSSSDIYGYHEGKTAGEKAFVEEDPFHIVNPYALSKVGGEVLCGFYTRVEGLDIVIARPFPHTGPGQSSDFVCSDWARQVVQIDRGKLAPVIRVGNLEVKRDFCDVRDTVRAYFLLLQNGKRGEIYNVCRGEGIVLRKVLEVLLHSAAKEVTVEQDPAKMRKIDIPFLVGDNGKLRTETAWEPQIPLEHTLLELLDYWRARP